MKTPAQLLQPLCRFAQRLYRNQRGAVAPLFLVSSGLVFGTGVGSIDLMRYTSVKAHLQAALDNAALAAGKLASLDGIDAPLLAEAQGYFQANFPNNYLGSRINAAGLSLQTDGSTLTLTVDGNMPLLSTGFLDISAFGLESSAVVALDGKGPSEVVFALDRGYADDKRNKGQGKKEGFDDPVNTAANNLAELLLPEENAGGGVHVGVVPFAENVNVGAAGKSWVARWYEEWAGDQRLDDTNKNYTQNLWRGCIAEPQPWLAPSLASVDPLSPNARFQPVFVRVKTELSEKANGPSWKGLPLNENGSVDKKSEVDPAGLNKGDLVTLEPNGSQYDRRLWAEFAGDPGPGNSTGYTFDVYGAFEPENCLTANRIRFLSEERDNVLNALSSVGSERPRGYTLLPAGMLWSWRMLLPEWRDGDGWSAPASLNADTNKQRAIVLFATGNNDNWDVVNDMPSPPIHKSDFLWERGEGSDNEFAFRMDYRAKDCKNKNKCDDPEDVTHIQAPFIPEVKPGNLPSKTEPYWQFPATALLLPDPFGDARNPNTYGWPSMNDYTREVCDAIKADGIEIYVVDVNDTGSSVLSHCSSDGILYSLDRVPELRNVIQVTQTSGEKLRLIR